MIDVVAFANKTEAIAFALERNGTLKQTTCGAAFHCSVEAQDDPAWVVEYKHDVPEFSKLDGFRATLPDDIFDNED